MMNRDDVVRWVDGYERSWRSPGTAHLADIFSADVEYRPSPWREAVQGLEALARFWETGRDGPDEPFTMTSTVVAVDSDTAVVRLAVEYFGTDRSLWRDLWVLDFDASGRCRVFEEWPFAPGQRDGHEDD